MQTPHNFIIYDLISKFQLISSSSGYSDDDNDDDDDDFILIEQLY